MALADVRFGAHYGLTLDVARGPKSAHEEASRRSLDYLVGQQEEFARDYQPQFFRRFQIEDEL